jgi:hypothetical protein
LILTLSSSGLATFFFLFLCLVQCLDTQLTEEVTELCHVGHLVQFSWKCHQVDCHSYPHVTLIQQISIEFWLCAYCWFNHWGCVSQHEPWAHLAGRWVDKQTHHLMAQCNAMRTMSKGEEMNR